LFLPLLPLTFYPSSPQFSLQRHPMSFSLLSASFSIAFLLHFHLSSFSMLFIPILYPFC
jgi:hypothetical protein